MKCPYPPLSSTRKHVILRHQSRVWRKRFLKLQRLRVRRCKSLVTNKSSCRWARRPHQDRRPLYGATRCAEFQWGCRIQQGGMGAGIEPCKPAPHAAHAWLIRQEKIITGGDIAGYCVLIGNAEQLVGKAGSARLRSENAPPDQVKGGCQTRCAELRKTTNF